MSCVARLVQIVQDERLPMAIRLAAIRELERVSA